MKHLVFYDGECGFCDWVVRTLLKIDRKRIFAFAPLQGSTAKELLKDFPEAYKSLDSLVLIENYQSQQRTYYVLGQGAFRILWLVGGWWKLIGWIHFLPPFIYNFGYRFIAQNRHLILSKESCRIPSTEDRARFLD